MLQLGSKIPEGGIGGRDFRSTLCREHVRDFEVDLELIVSNNNS